MVLHWRLQNPFRGPFDVSHLRYTPPPVTQQQAAVKFLGSSRPTGGPWPLHQEGVFAGSQPGTVERSLRRSQSRHLNGKALRLLKRVRVTPAANGPLTRLDPGFRYPCWAGVADRTSPFGVAVRYVFGKQSRPPSHCDQQ